MKKNRAPSIAYMTFTGSIPSRSADAVCVMNMCSALAGRGSKVELIVPRGQALQLGELGFQGSIWQFYGLPENFSIRYLPNPFDRFSNSIRRSGFGFLAVCYATAAGRQLINARQIELVLAAARFGRPFVFECHNF